MGKDPRSRYQSVLDVGHDLSDSRNESEAGPAARTAGGVSGPGSAATLLQHPVVLGACAACLVAGALIAAALMGALGVEPAAPLRKFQMGLDNLGRDNAAISPDGSLLAYVHEDRLWVRFLDQDEGRAIPGTEDAERIYSGHPTVARSATLPDGLSGKSRRTGAARCISATCRRAA